MYPKTKNGSIRQQNLYKVLTGKYIPADTMSERFSTYELKNTSGIKQLKEAYQELNGTKDIIDIRFNEKLMEFGRFSVILDNQLHFNKYRIITLRSLFYETTHSFSLTKYRNYCRKYEHECLKSGVSYPYWTNPDAEYHFGQSQVNGDLGLNGSSGWKFTALKDMALDLIARQRKIRLLRLSVWDELMIDKKLVRLNELLVNPDNNASEAILKFAERKIIMLYA